MYEAHPAFLDPPDIDCSVWRYMDFAKFVDVVSTGELFFARADCLGDPFEGSYPRPDIEERQQRYRVAAANSTAEARAQAELSLEHRAKLTRAWREGVGVNCWHMNPMESAAMWSLYLRSNDGIAIRSSYRRLRDCFRDTRAIYLGKVTYMDYQTGNLPNLNLLHAFVHKLMSYEHEREVRALIINHWDAGGGLPGPKPIESGGLRVRVDLNDLVESIYVAPTAGDWLPKLVSSVVHRLGYDFKVVSSSLSGEPLF